MSAPSPVPHTALRKVWLRRGVFPNPYSPRRQHPVWLSQLGNAAAHETFVTATSPFAAVWTDLFRNMLAQVPVLRWRQNGPGIGRDARIAYSSLLGRYMARAYLTVNEGVRVLVPLDTARLAFRGSSYRVGQPPRTQALEADWIGLDNRRRLVIAEAKGSFDKRTGTWRGPNSVPQVLRNAMQQAQRTEVFRNSAGGPLPAKRWAVASRWANESTRLAPTLLAWDTDEGKLDNVDYWTLWKLLHRADLEALMMGLGHPQAVQILESSERMIRVPGDVRLRVGRRTIERGFAALVGPIGIHPLRNRGDLDRLHHIRALTLDIALASLSSRYARTITREPRQFDEEVLGEADETARDGQERFAQRAGLTVAWLTPEEDIVLAED